MNSETTATNSTLGADIARVINPECAMLSHDANKHNDLPNELDFPDGLVGDLAKEILENSIKPQKTFAIGAAITAAAALIGRWVKDTAGQFTNIYMLALGPTSSGKDAPFKKIAELYRHLNKQELVFAEVTSDSAIEACVADYPAGICQLDEIGHYIGSVRDKGANNSYARTIIPALTKLWSAPVNDGEYIGKCRAAVAGKRTPPVRIHTPVVSIYATGTPETLFSHLRRDDLADGTLNRFVCVTTTDIPDSRDNYVYHELNPELIGKFKDTLAKLGVPAEGIGHFAADHRPKTFSPTDGARKVLQDLDKEANNHLCDSDLLANDPSGYLYGKAGENARRIALTIACFRNPSEAIIEKSDAEYAVKFVRNSIRVLTDGVQNHVADSKHDAQLKIVELILRKHKELTRSELTERTRRLTTNERKECLMNLIEMNKIEERLVPGSGGKDITMYIYRGQ